MRYIATAGTNNLESTNKRQTNSRTACRLLFIALCLLSLPLSAQNLINTSVGYKVVVEIPVVNTGTPENKRLVPAVEVYGSGITVDEITPIADRNIDHMGNETQLIKRTFYVAPNSEIRLGVVNEYRFVRGLQGVTTGTSSTSFYKWTGGVATAQTISIAGTPSNANPDRGLAMTFTTPASTSATGEKFGGKTIYKDQDVVATLTLKLNVADNIGGRQVLNNGTAPDFIGSAVGMSFGNPITLNTFQDMLGLQGLIRMKSEGTTDYNADCYGYIDATSGASKIVSYRETLDRFKAKGIDYTRQANLTTDPATTSAFFASQYYSITEGITLPGSYSGLGQPNPVATTLANVTNTTNAATPPVPFIGFIECGERGSISMQYHDAKPDAYYKLYGFLKLFGYNSLLCVARNLNIQGLVEVNCADATTASGRISGGLAAVVNGTNAFLINGRTALSSDVNTGGEVISGGVVGYLNGAASIPAYAMYDPATPPDALEEGFNHRNRLDNIGSQFRANSRSAHTYLSGGIGYANLTAGNGGISRVEVSIEGGQLLTRAFTHAYAGGVIGNMSSAVTTTLRGCRVISKTGFQMRAATENTTATAANVYSATIAGYMNATTGTFQLFSNARITTPTTNISIFARDEYTDCNANLYASGYFAYINNPTLFKAIFRNAKVTTEGTLNVQVVQNGDRSTNKAVGGIYGYGLPNFDYPSDPGYIFEVKESNLNLSIEEKTTSASLPVRGTSYGGLFCGYPSRNITAGDFNRCDFTFTGCRLSITSEADSKLSTTFNYYLGGLLGRTTTATNTIDGLRLTLDNTHIEGIQRSYQVTGTSSVFAGGVVGDTPSSASPTHLLHLTVTGRNGSVISADNAANSLNAEPFAGGIVGHCNGTRIVECTVQGDIPDSQLLTETNYPLVMKIYNRNNGNTPGVGGIIGRSGTSSVNYNPYDPYNSSAPDQRPCLVSDCRVDKVLIYGYGYTDAATSNANDILVGGIIGVNRKNNTAGNLGVRLDVTNSLIVCDGEDKIDVKMGGISGGGWSGSGSGKLTYPEFDRCTVRGCRLVARAQKSWAVVAGIYPLTSYTVSNPICLISNCLVLDTKIEVSSYGPLTVAGGIFGYSGESTGVNHTAHLESCFSNAEFVMINPDPSKIQVGGLAVGGVQGSYKEPNKVTATNCFFDSQKAGTTNAWSKPSVMPNGVGYDLDFSNQFLVDVPSVAVFNPKTVSGGSAAPGSSNLQESTTGTGGNFPYSTKITYADESPTNDTVMHQAQFNTALAQPSWELRQKAIRPVGSRLPAELWVSPWTGAPMYKLGEIHRVVVPMDTVTHVTPTTVHLHKGVGITGHEFALPIETEETQYNDPTPILLTSYAEVAEDLGIPVDPNNYKDERRVIRWWYSLSPATDANRKFTSNILSGTLPATFVETNYHLTINCNEPILSDVVFYVQSSDFRGEKFSVPIKVIIRYLPPVSITIDPIYGTRPERGTQTNPFVLRPDGTYLLHSVIEPADISNDKHQYALPVAVGKVRVTSEGNIFVNGETSGTTFKITVTTIAKKADNSYATDEIWCKIATPVPVSFSNNPSSSGSGLPNTVIDPLSPYTFTMAPVLGYTYLTAPTATGRTPKNVTIILQHASLPNDTVKVVTGGVVNATQTLLQLPPGFDWTAEQYTLDPAVLDNMNTLNPITGIILDIQYYKQINITFDHNDGKTFFVYSLHEGGKLDQLVNMATEPGLHPDFPGLNFLGWLEQRTPTVAFVSGYDITKAFNTSIRLYAILSLEFQYGATHDSYTTYANAHPTLNGALSPPTLTPSDRKKPASLNKVRPEELLETDYTNLNQVPIVLSNGIRFNIYLTDNKHQPNNILLYTGLTNGTDFASGTFRSITFSFVEKGEETIQFATGPENLYYYTYYIPQSELFNLQGEGRLFFLFDNIYKVSHETIGTIPTGATERQPLFYHRDQTIDHSSYPSHTNHVYVGWKGVTSKGTNTNYEVGDQMPEQEIRLQGKWAVAQVKNLPTDDFYTTNIQSQELYDHLYPSLNAAYAAATVGQTVQLMANTTEDITFNKQIIYDSKFTVPREKINDNENKIDGTVTFAANTNANDRSTGTANVRLYHDLVATNVAIQAHTLGNKALIDYQGNGTDSKVKADQAHLDLSIPTLGTFEDYYAWYPVNLPFDARVSSITNTVGKGLLHPEEFGIAQYSGSRRALHGIGNTPHLKQNDWLYIAPPTSAPDFSTRDLTILSEHIGNDQTIAAHTAYMVNNRRKTSTLRFHALSGTFGQATSATVSAFAGSKGEAHNGWNYLSQSLGTNATIDPNTLPGTSTIIQVSNTYSSDIPATVTPAKQEASYLAIDLATTPNHVIAPYTNFYYQTSADGTINLTPSNNQADTRSTTKPPHTPPSDTRYALSLTAPDGTPDNLFISATPDTEAAHYRIGRDLLKMGIRNPHTTQLWSCEQGLDLCAVEAPLNNGEAHIPLTLNLPQAGQYRLTLHTLPADHSHLWLMQNNQPVVELTTAPDYTFTTTTVGQTNHYSLKLIVPTTQPTQPLHAYGGKGHITLDGIPNGTPYTVINMAGIVAVDATAHTTHFTLPLPSGLYLVSAAGKHTKGLVE